MYDGVTSQVIEFCSCCYSSEECLTDCLFKAECDEIRYTYGRKPYELKEEGVSMDLPNSTIGNKKKHVIYATEDQREYIETLLDKLGADLSDYTDTDLDSLTKSEASDIIDTLKDDVTDADAWDN